jgi:hypothetical protein
MRAQVHADLLHVRCLVVEVVEQQSQLAMGRPRVEVVTEVDALCSRHLFEVSRHRKVDGLSPQDPECDSAVLGARVARVA